METTDNQTINTLTPELLKAVINDLEYNVIEVEYDGEITRSYTTYYESDGDKFHVQVTFTAYISFYVDRGDYWTPGNVSVRDASIDFGDDLEIWSDEGELSYTDDQRIELLRAIDKQIDLL